MGYRSYSYTELILITDVYVFGSHLGVTELILIPQSLHLFGGTSRYHGGYGTYSGIAELILIREYL